MTGVRPTATPLYPTPPTRPPTRLPTTVIGPRRAAGPFEWVLLAVAWGSLAIGILLLVWSPQWLLDLDAAICAAFLVAIGWRWLRFRIGWRYLGKHWWEIVALVPLLVGGPLWIGIVIAVARFTRAADRTDNVFGDKITAQTINHFSAPIIDTIKRPITIAMLDEVIDVLREGTYAENARAALRENRAQLEAMVLELVRNDPTTGKLRYVPFHDDIVQMTSDTVLRIIDRALDDPRTTELISDIIRNSAAQLRQAIQEKE